MQEKLRWRMMMMNNELLTAMATVLEIPAESIFRKNRKGIYVMARTIMITQLRRSGWAWQKIARFFNLHHSSVIHCYHKYQDNYDYSLLFRFIVHQVQNYLANKPYLKRSDLTALIYSKLKQNKYYKTQIGVVRSVMAYSVFYRCGYANSTFPHKFVKINMLTMLDEQFIGEIYNQITEFVDVKSISARVS